MLGWTTSKKDPDTGTTTYSYDNAGQLLSTLDARGTTLSYTYDAVGRKRTVWNGAVTSGTKLAEWTYDTLASGTVVKGQPATSTRFHGPDQYKTEVTGYDDNYRPLGATVRIPVSQGSLAGPWTVGSTYKVDGSPASSSFPAAGGLAAETVNYSYDNAGHLLTSIGADSYVSGTSYYPWGDVYQRLLGTGSKRVRLTATVDEATMRLATNQTETENQTTPNTWNYALTERYGYDPAGNVKHLTEVNAAGGTVSNQCFNYDPLRQLTEAWTTNVATCQATPSQAVVNGPDPYWTSYTYSAIGNRQTEVRHAASGNTTRTYAYPASGPTSVRPHAATSVTASGATTGVDNYSYDNTGNATTRNIAGKPGQTLAWNPEGRLASVTETAGTTSYLYDADGGRLIESRPNGTATLFLPGFELIRDTAGTVTGTRFYGGVASRTSGTGLTWLTTDHHGTPQLAISAANLATTRRKSDPFGNPRGADPAWPNNRGYVNGVRDNTGLTHLGAREYEPATGRFISADPILVVTDPQQMNGYAYASSNPVTHSDPTGTCYKPCFDDEYYGSPGINPEQHRDKDKGARVKNNKPKATPPPPQPIEDKIRKAEAEAEKAKQVIIDAGKALAKIAMDVLGVTDALNCFTKGDLGSCISVGVDILLTFVGGLIGKLLAKYGLPWNLATGIRLANKVRELVAKIVRSAHAWWKNTKSAKQLRRCAGSNSFVAGTGVLMADGTVIPIEDVDVGDVVLATDPQTGDTKPQIVTATIHGAGQKTLVELTVDLDGPAGDREATIVATDMHPIWAVDRGLWLDAGELRAGQLLRTAAGRTVTITATRARQQYRHVHNLTIADIHTYYVMAGTAPVLVHNCGDSVTLYRNVDAAEFDDIARTGKFQAGEGNMEGKWFATQEGHADQWGEKLNGGQGLTVETRVPRSTADQLHHNPGKLDGIGSGYYADADGLDLINRTCDGIRAC
jgi:RHS repeat-associated protein